MTPRLALVLLLFAASSVTCLVPDTNHCAHQPGQDRGHEWCAQQYPDRPLCSRCASASANEYSGCVEQETDPACLVGSVQQGDGDASSNGLTSDDSGTTTAAGGCVPSECEARDPSRPACDDLGECVTCTRTDPGVCSGSTPICDEATQECIPCSLHSQCLDAMGSACHIEQGECLPPDRVWHVRGGAADGDGTEAAPFRTIYEAMANIPPEGQGTVVLHEARDEAGDEVAYDEVVTIRDNRLVAIVTPRAEPPEPPERPRIVLNTASALVTIVDEGTIVYLDGLSLQSNVDGPGLRIEKGRVHVDRCEVTKNRSGIEVVDGGELELRNSIVTAAVDAQNALYVDAATAAIAYSTVIHTSSDFSAQDPSALLCLGKSPVTVRKSIVLSLDGDANGWECPGAHASDSAVDGMLAEVTEVNNVYLCDILNCASASAIPSLFDALSSLRLSSVGAEILAGVPSLAPDDPPFDIDLNPRPSASGIDYVGAHVPPG